MLYYYTDESMKELKGEINLTDCRQLQAYHYHPKHKWCFSCVCTHREYFLAAETEAEMMQWVHVIQSMWKAAAPSRRPTVSAQRPKGLSGPAPPPLPEEVAAFDEESPGPVEAEPIGEAPEDGDDDNYDDPDDYENNGDASDDELFTEIDNAVAGKSPEVSPLKAILFPPPPPPPASDEGTPPTGTPPTGPPPSGAPIRKSASAALYPYTAAESNQLSIQVGQNLEVIKFDSDWSLVRAEDGTAGYVPTSYIKA